jgi:hypothetical protein
MIINRSHAVAQAVNSRPPITEARFQTMPFHVGFMVEIVELRKDF